MQTQSDSTALPTNAYENFQFNMIRYHECIKLGYEGIVSRLDHPPRDDMKNFLGYCDAWAQALIHHHDGEEKVVFPFLNQKLDFSNEVEQHKIVHEGLDELFPLLKAGMKDPDSFDLEGVKKLMKRLQEPLFQHLDEEVEHVSPENLKVFTEKDIQKNLDDLITFARKDGDSFILAPFMTSHTFPMYKDVWPEIPWFVRNLIMPYVLGWRHSGYWKYSPYPV